jgi:hypothetical protein
VLLAARPPFLRINPDYFLTELKAMIHEYKRVQIIRAIEHNLCIFVKSTLKINAVVTGILVALGGLLVIVLATGAMICEFYTPESNFIKFLKK